MKRHLISLLRFIPGIIAICTIGLLSACGDDDETPFVPQPSITFDATGNGEISFNDDRTELSLTSGTAVTWSFNLNTPGGFRSFVTAGFRENIVIEDENSTDAVVSISEDRTTATISNLTTTFSGNDEIEISFITTDELEQSNVVRITVKISSPDARTFSDITMMSPVQNSPDSPEDERTSATWFSANLGETITSADIVAGSSLSKDVDFGFYFSGGQAVLSSPENFPASEYNLSPNGQNWSTLHITTFRTLTISQSNFFTIRSAFEIDEAYNDGEDTAEDGEISNVTAGTAFGFQTDVDKDGGIIGGVLFIGSVAPAPETSPASILIDVKVQ